ncbi:MAG: recombinase family protein [Roseburia sp.]|nr:recombinase family protein [bacterium]MDY4112376.1 recombinase family protein [Roseburia sp.]
MPRITQISPSVPKIKTKLKVAAYARVSVETEMLMHSLSAQVSYYSSLIQKNPEWEYAGVYADEGITGTSTVHRDEFNRLVADCEAGKIDMVLVKSISRFARDTVDCLNTTRHLKELGIAVYFEREKINSLAEDGELMLTLLASFAQEESRSISENIKWATRKRFEKGIPNGHKAPYGYEWDGEMFRIIPKQGEVVKEIYSRYLAGESAYIIAKTLAERGVTGQMGKPIEQTTVKEILSSRSYTGTMVLQKNYLTEGHIRKRNKGELPMYLVDEMFEPLVSEEDYQRALEIRQRRAELFPNNQDNLTVFSGKVKCGYCGCGISRRTSGSRKRWVCNTRERKGMKSCECRPIWETELIDAATQVLGETFDESAFSREVKQVTLYSDRIEFSMQNGNCKTIFREYNGQRGQNSFTNKIWCGSCGCKCKRSNYGKKKVWCCSQPRTMCQMKRLPESELLEAAEGLLGENFHAKVAADIERIIVFDDALNFEFKNGTVKIWQRK